MAAPEYVPASGAERPPSYVSPPRRADSWLAVRPGELGSEQPAGPAMGSQGPDQGYALRLARRLAGRAHLASGEQIDDIVAGAVAIGLKRASLYGRAPVGLDIEMALQLFGYLDTDPPAALVAARRELFTGVANPHHYLELRRVADSVPAATLLCTPGQLTERLRSGWESLVDLETDAAAGAPHGAGSH